MPDRALKEPDCVFGGFLVVFGDKLAGQDEGGAHFRRPVHQLGQRTFAIMQAMQSDLTEEAKKLSIPDRISLVEEIWDTIAEENEAFELTDGQKRELDRRLDVARGNLGAGRTWDEIKAEFMKSR